VDVFEMTVEDFPDDPAIDNGAAVLTYREFYEAADEVAAILNGLGIGREDRVGVRMKSGTVELYVAIMGVLLSGGCYVPVDADDPDERARTVFDEADVAAIIGDDLVVTSRGAQRSGVPAAAPQPDDDAWVIFTSGSTGTPKGVAVSHRSAAAFVDAEARMYLQERPLGVGDRVMAGLSVGFDASCEEMWLAWRYGSRSVAGRERRHCGLHRPHLVDVVARCGPGRNPTAHPRGRSVPARDRCQVRVPGARGVEHLRTYRGHRRLLRSPADGRATGADRTAARRVGPRGRR
jgi:non-ribosomal peptide synthetase component F